MAFASRKPTLALSTPVTASFPADALRSAASVRTPASGISPCWRDLPSAGLPSAGLPSAGLSSASLQSPLFTIKTEEGLLKTPITPPMAYMDFLKMASPVTSLPPAPTSAFPEVPARLSVVTAATAAAAVASEAAASSPVEPTAAALLPAASTAGENTKAGDTAGTSQEKTKPATSDAVSGSDSASASASTATSRRGSRSSHCSSHSSGSSTCVSTASMFNAEDTTPASSTAAAPAATASALSNPPSSATTTATDCCTCDFERAHKSPKLVRIDTSASMPSPASPFRNHPMSAPAMGRTGFPSLKVPASPALSNASQVNTPIRSPFSAKLSATSASHFDWEAALKARRLADGKPATGTSSAAGSQHQQHAHSSSASSSSAAAAAAAAAAASAAAVAAAAAAAAANGAKSPATSSRTSIRHIREVVTRTVTYTPRMHPAPKGKKRKVDCDSTTCS